MNAEEWRNFHKKPGGKAVCENELWLLEGCPYCGNKTWEVTSDYYAYCLKCYAGFATAYPFTNRVTEYFDETGYHCGMCHGLGHYLNNEVCDRCGGKVTRIEADE